MAGKVFSLEPKDVKKIRTPYRRIRTKIPVPQSVSILKQLRRYEPLSMTGQPPVVWDKASGVQVRDRYGNMWLDWSSGVLVVNAGHGRKQIVEAIVKTAKHGLLHNYCFPSESRAKLARKLVEVSPKGLDKAFILTTGSEATECVFKLSRTYGLRKHGREKIGMVSFAGAFHGRTLGAQMMGGIPSLKEWIVNLDCDMHVVPFPGDFRCEDKSFSVFEETLRKKGVTPERIAGVITETYQGGGASFLPVEYMKELRAWCNKHDVLLTCDEIQAGFGRTGTLFGFEHYGIVPDLVCLGKGISSSLPVSAVVGRKDVMDLYGPAEMTSTHTGNPVCAEAALASIGLVIREKLHANAKKMGMVLQEGLRKLAEKFPAVGAVHGKGLVAGLHIVKPGTKDPDGELAFRIVEKCMEKGLLMFAPVGFGSATVKISPPLCIKPAAVRDGLSALEEAMEEAVTESGSRARP